MLHSNSRFAFQNKFSYTQIYFSWKYFSLCNVLMTSWYFLTKIVPCQTTWTTDGTFPTAGCLCRNRVAANSHCEVRRSGGREWVCHIARFNSIRTGARQIMQRWRASNSMAWETCLVDGDPSQLVYHLFLPPWLYTEPVLYDRTRSLWQNPFSMTEPVLYDRTRSLWQNPFSMTEPVLYDRTNTGKLK